MQQWKHSHEVPTFDKCHSLCSLMPMKVSRSQWVKVKTYYMMIGILAAVPLLN